MNDGGEHSRRPPRPDKAERLAQALRDNLKRRKAQARGRSDRSEAGVPPESTPKRSDREGG
jgi:hypothetical protein